LQLSNRCTIGLRWISVWRTEERREHTLQAADQKIRFPAALGEFLDLRTTTTDQSRLVAADVVLDLSQVEPRHERATSPDLSRQDATAPGILEKYVARLEGEVEFLPEENATKNVASCRCSSRGEGS
jgi:hypothetical protein